MTDKRDNLYDLIKGFKTAMLTTRLSDGELHVRPMQVAKMGADQQLIFATGASSPKIDEIKHDNDVVVSFQDSSKYAVIYGKAEVTADRALINEVWSEAWRVWFPDGKDDANIRLLVVTPASAEYWDLSGFEGIKFLYESLKAILQKQTPAQDETQHAKITM